MINRDYYIFTQYQTFLLGDTQQINVVKSKQKSEKHKAFTFVKTFSNSLKFCFFSKVLLNFLFSDRQMFIIASD